jgi:hypothetical protein
VIYNKGDRVRVGVDRLEATIVNRKANYNPGSIQYGVFIYTLRFETGVKHDLIGVEHLFPMDAVTRLGELA